MSKEEPVEAWQLRKAALRYAEAKLFGTIVQNETRTHLGTQQEDTVKYLAQDLLRMAEWYFQSIANEAVKEELER